jgi:ankyrin repeat protein
MAPWSKGKGTYALQMAAGTNRSRIGMVRLLIEAGADINSMPDFDDIYLGYNYIHIQTALHCAAKTGTEEVVALLMDYGADSTKLDGYGCTAIEQAEIHGRFELVDLIRSYETGASGAITSQATI